MRVIHCVRSTGFAGVERYLTYVAPELARRGWEVTVIGGEENRMRQELGPVAFLPASTTKEVCDRLRKVDSDLVHAHMTAAELAAVIDHFRVRRPLVTTRHFAAVRGSTPPARIAARVVARSLSAQVSISQFVAERIGEGSVVILNGVPAVEGERAPQRIVLVAQRLDPEKNTLLALDAWARSSLPKNGWKLVIAGDGKERSALEGHSSRLGIAPSVEFLGRRSDVMSLMSRASVLLAPAPEEPFGFSVVEAMARGLPVIAARGGAHPETVGAACPDWLFPSHDPEAAASLLDKLCGDTALQERYGTALRSWQRNHLSVTAHVDRLEALYEEVLR